MTEIAQLEARVREANQALNVAKAAETHRINRPLLGKCFKFRNCFSCPEKPSDYWWVYYRVMDVDGANVTVHQFQTDKHGRMEVNFESDLYWWHGPTTGYQPIKTSEFLKAWRAFKKRVASR